MGTKITGKIALTVALLTTGMCCNAQLRYHGIGITGGMNVSTLSHSSMGEMQLRPRVGYHMGFFAIIPTDKFFNVQVEINYSTAGARVTNFGNETLNTDMVELPVMLKCYFADKWSVDVGPKFSLLIEDEIHPDLMDMHGGISGSGNGSRRGELALVAGISYVNPWFVTSLRYEGGLHSVYKGGRLRNNIFKLSFGVFF